MKTRISQVLVAASMGLAAPAARGDQVSSVEVAAPAPVATRELSVPAAGATGLRMWRFELGDRSNFVTDAGLNPFSAHDYLGQVSLAASRTLWTHGRFAFAPGVAWDYGRHDSNARGDATSLSVHRLEVLLEGRVHLGPWGYAFLRAAPGFALERAEVDDPTAPAALQKTRWLFATDVSAGYAYPVWARDEPGKLPVSVWLQADGGFGWVVAQRLNLTPDLGSGDARPASGVDLGSLALNGAFFRAAAAIGF